MNESCVADRWRLLPEWGILWDVAADARLPHEDHLEMSGRLVSLLVHYGVNSNRELILRRRVVAPTLRTIPNNTHASWTVACEQDVPPPIRVAGQTLASLKVDRVVFDGTLTFFCTIAGDIQIRRTIFPAADTRAMLENWTLVNRSARAVEVEIGSLDRKDLGRGTTGIYVLDWHVEGGRRVVLDAGRSMEFGIVAEARRWTEKPTALSVAGELADREQLIRGFRSSLRLETGEAVLDRAFDFAKLRAAESIFDTQSGPLHGPGGGAYYAAVWCNDQVEYAGPFFPFMGDDRAIQASLLAYRLYMPFMGPEYQRIPSSIVAEGLDIWEGAGDRGDAAMYAYGASRFALATGRREIAEELFPAIQWCLEYCRRQLTPDGVVASDSDELEGRFPAGKTNLSTSTLTYGGLQSAADLADSLGQPATAAEYRQRALALADAIERFFGAEIEGFATYRYHEDSTALRSWICLPLTMGIMKRAGGTIGALFSPSLWTPDGVATLAGDKTFWDRSTLYAFRGALNAGCVEGVMPFLSAYVRRRLLGEHVPYAVEAYPEGGQSHLSAESALFCRVITEGLFGITVTGLSRFTLTPRLPAAWKRMALRDLRLFGRRFDLEVVRQGAQMQVRLQDSRGLLSEATTDTNGSITFDLA